MVTYVLKSEKYGSLVPDAVPIGWDNSSRSLERTAWHSVSVETSQELTFYGDAATYLKRAYESDGIEAEVYLDFYRQDDQDLINVLEYEARINFTEYNLTPKGHVKVSTEQVGFARKLKSADKAKIDLLNTQPLEGNVPLPEMPVRTVNLHSKSILKQTEMQYEGEESILIWTLGTNEVKLYQLVLPNSHFISREVEEAFSQGPVVYGPVDENEASGSPNATLTPTEAKVYVLKFKESGSFSAIVDYDLTNFVTVIGQIGNTTSLIIKHVRGAEESTSTKVLTDEYGSPDAYRSSFNLTLSLKGSFSISTETSSLGEAQPGDELYVYLQHSITHYSDRSSDIRDDYTVNHWGIKVTGITSTEGTTGEAVYFGDALARTVESLTGQINSCDNAFYSLTDSYGEQSTTDKLAGKRLLMSGIHVRGWDLSEKPLVVSLADLLKTAYVLDTIGMGIRKETDGSYRAYLAPVKDFYKDEVVLDLGHVAELSEKVQLDKIYNKVTSGYNKYDTDSTNSLDEFNTVREWKPYITQHENEYRAVSPIRADGYGLETARRQGREVNPNKSTPYDKDSFLVCFRRETGQLYSEDGSSLTESANLLDPATVYNARLSPQRIRKKHEHLFSGCLQKAPDKKFLFTSGEVNTAMISRLPGEDAAIEENSGSTNKNLAKPLFLPETYEFEKVLTSEQVRILATNPHGTIAFKDSSGTDHYGFLQKAEIDFYNKTTFTLLRKYTDG